MPGSTPRLHHYFPRFNLSYFADDQSRIWTFDKRERLNPNPKRIPLSALAAEAHLYDDDAPEDPLIGVEEWLAKEIDGPASSAVRKVIDKSPIQAKERESLARYVLSRDLRSPKTRDFIISDAQSRLESDYDSRMANASEIRKAILEESGEDISEERIIELSKIYRPAVTKGFWLEFLQRHAVEAAPRLLAKGWTLFHADSDCQFITSDTGIVKFRGGWDKPIRSGPGWWHNSDGWMMPLTPKVALAMAVGVKPDEKLAQAAFVEPFNLTIAQQAAEFVFAADREALGQSLIAV